MSKTVRVQPMSRECSIALVLLGALLLAGCRADAPQALGTLEYDRVTLPAPVAERIVSIDVREGQRVEAGAKLLTLETTRTEAQAQAAQAQARDASAYYARLQPLGKRQLVAAAEVDRARAAAGNAQAQVRAAQAALDELLHGTREEQLAQGEAALQAAQAQARAEQATLRKLDVVAPRAGRIDSIPYKLGDQSPVGAPLVVMLVGDTPHARVYVPEPIRADVAVGQRARVFVDGRDQAFEGTVRMIRSEPTFTPYYALTGDDAARLSYLAEIQLAPGVDLPAGLPVRVEFVAGDGQ